MVAVRQRPATRRLAAMAALLAEVAVEAAVLLMRSAIQARAATVRAARFG